MKTLKVISDFGIDGKVYRAGDILHDCTDSHLLKLAEVNVCKFITFVEPVRKALDSSGSSRVEDKKSASKTKSSKGGK